MPSKALRYLGLARRAGAVVSGSYACTESMSKGRAHLLIIAEDTAPGSRKKLLKTAQKHRVETVDYGSGEELSHMTGTGGKRVFAITDEHFAEIILQEIHAETR